MFTNLVRRVRTLTARRRTFALIPLALALMLATLISLSPATAQRADAATGLMTIRGQTLSTNGYSFSAVNVYLYVWNGSGWAYTGRATTSDGAGNFALVAERGAHYVLVAQKIVGQYCAPYGGYSQWYTSTGSFYLGAATSNPFRMNLTLPLTYRC